MRPDEIDFLVELVRIRAGYSLDRDKTYLMESRLAPVARREGFSSIRDLLMTTRQRRDDRLAWTIVEAMVCGETSFFRDRAPFVRLRQDILPRLAVSRRDGPVRIWSAGCASGQEPYSLAMILEEEAPALGGATFELVASDLSQRALERARSGLYTQFEVQRGLPARALVRHFERREDMWVASAALRAAVQWRRLNLNADFRPLGQFDIILCRHVIKHMEPAAAERMLEQMRQLLTPNGVLIVAPEDPTRSLGDALETLEPGILMRPSSQRAAA